MKTTTATAATFKSTKADIIAEVNRALYNRSSGVISSGTGGTLNGFSTVAFNDFNIVITEATTFYTAKTKQIKLTAEYTNKQGDLITFKYQRRLPKRLYELKDGGALYAINKLHKDLYDSSNYKTIR